MAKNQAAWITEAKGKPLKVQEAPDPKPGPGEVVIKNAAIAINVCVYSLPLPPVVLEACILAGNYWLQKHPHAVCTIADASYSLWIGRFRVTVCHTAILNFRTRC